MSMLLTSQLGSAIARPRPALPRQPVSLQPHRPSAAQGRLRPQISRQCRPGALWQDGTLPRRPSLAARADGGGDTRRGSSALQGLVASPLYRIWLQLGVVLLLLMLVDAGFSGDWSRIGAITTDQEAALRQGAAYVGCFHLLCGATAAAVSSQRGEQQWPARTAKVLAVGGLALLEVLLLPESKEQQR